MTPLISVIIPIYNAEKTLSKCLNSLRAQTMHEWEAVCVDDGSSDESLNILKEISQSDSRICVYAKLNGGVSDARNMGLLHVRSHYVMMLDADDTLHPLALEKMYAKMISRKECDLVVCAHNRVTSSGCFLHNWSIRCDGYVDLTTDDVLNIIGAPWAKLYRRDIIDSIKLNFTKELSVSEDDLFVKSYLSRCRQICYVMEPLYNYEFSETSVIHRFETGIADFSQYEGVLKLPLLLSEFLNRYPAGNEEQCAWGRVVLEIILRSILWIEWSVPHTRLEEKRKLRQIGCSYLLRLGRRVPIGVFISTCVRYGVYYAKGRCKRLLENRQARLKVKK